MTKQAPQTISSKFILHSTYYDVMSNGDREKVFKAYQYNRQRDIYELKNPQYLDQSIIDKLIG